MKETITVRLEHPVWTGLWIAFGFFLFSIIMAILGWFTLMSIVARMASDVGIIKDFSTVL